MKVEIEVLSKDTVKPSSQTPHHLKNYQLSFLDQVNPPVFMPLVLFYPADDNLNNSDQRSIQLKKSLSLALAKFYPLAGRLVDNCYVNCNDDGVVYVEARANCKISHVLSEPIPEEFNKFLPSDLDDVRDLNLVIQVNFFDCGGMAMGIGVSHKVADAASLFMFVNCWAAICRGDANIPSPRFDSAALFQPRDVSGFKPTTGIVKAEEVITKRFVFTASNINALRDKYTHDVNGEYPMSPTRIEALSAFIWTRLIAAVQAKANPSKIYAFLHAVNLRTRVDPPLPGNLFGNLSRPAITVPSVGKDNTELGYEIVEKMREAIGNVSGDSVTKIRQGDDYLNFLKEEAEKFTKGETVTFSFTSLCRFPLYEADFGWGRPVWVSSASFCFKNLVVFLDTQSGDGIEAWVHLKREDMAKFEADKELLAFVS